jgi:hypothetical protein
MPSRRRVAASFEWARPRRSEAAVGVELGFRAPASLLDDAERLEDFADLGPQLCVPAVAGIGKVLRILRAARIAPPRDPLALLGREEDAASLLGRALGARVLLEVRPRSRLRFVAWTETGVEVVDEVADVIEESDVYLVVRRGGRWPVRISRASVVRRRTVRERWWEIVGVEREAAS